MSFGLCNAPKTFQRCRTAIFHEPIKDSIEVFMDDFSVFDSSFDHCLKNLEKMLKRCEETNLVLNEEKCNFMVKEEIVPGHKVSGSGIEVDKAKIKEISKLPYPTNIKAIQIFLGHQEFDIKIRDKKGTKNLATDHLSRLENPDLGKLTKVEIRDLFPEEQLITISDKSNEPWCVARNEAAQILRQCDSRPLGGHHSIATTAWKVFEVGFYWPNIFRDTRKLVRTCDTSQRARNISSRDETSQKYIQRCSKRSKLPQKIIRDWDTEDLDKSNGYPLLQLPDGTINEKERTKRWHDKRIKAPTKYEKGDKVLLFNSHLRLFPRKLKSRWYGTFAVSKDMKNGAIKLYNEGGNEFIVNKQHVKPYQKDASNVDKDDDITLEDKGEVT
ncbi:reverse transcriptase domain-containing protein [Tanacetum coccineum]|uniref:Reverse transcriptase domain-containing protein n=1 Tax=Tanacetum coccineum TaxID=301880 RepID=A0ABQ5CTV2_9ASTR